MDSVGTSVATDLKHSVRTPEATMFLNMAWSNFGIHVISICISERTTKMAL